MSFPPGFWNLIFRVELFSIKCLSLSFGVTKMKFHQKRTPLWNNSPLATGKIPTWPWRLANKCLPASTGSRPDGFWSLTPTIQKLCVQSFWTSIGSEISAYSNQRVFVNLRSPNSSFKIEVLHDCKAAGLKEHFSFFKLNWSLVSNFPDQVITCLPYIDTYGIPIMLLVLHTSCLKWTYTFHRERNKTT